MKRLFITILSGLALMSAVSSCDFVFEDRTDCPCYLIVNMDEVFSPLPSPGSVTVRVEGVEGFLSENSVDPDPYRGTEGYVVKVKKGPAAVIGYVGRRSMAKGASGLTVTKENEMDSLWAHRNTVDCSGELAYDIIRLHKQFATLTVFLKDSGIEGEVEMELVGGWQGMSYSDLGAMKGDYLFTMRHPGGDEFIARVPRQGDRSLRLNLYQVEEGKKTFVSYFPVGEYIEREGYDWTKEDLDDITVRIDYAQSVIEVSVEGWKDGGEESVHF